MTTSSIYYGYYLDYVVLFCIVVTGASEGIGRGYALEVNSCIY